MLVIVVLCIIKKVTNKVQLITATKRRPACKKISTHTQSKGDRK